jgi:ABC-type Fe3+-citrate transport system substrate-binding protein
MMEKTKKIAEAEKKVKEVEEKMKRNEKLLCNNKTKINRLEKEVSLNLYCRMSYLINIYNDMIC